MVPQSRFMPYTTMTQTRIQDGVLAAGAAATRDARHEPIGRLRILHVINHLIPGGTEYTLLKLIQNLGETDFEHRICAVRWIDSAFAVQHNVQQKVYVAGTRDMKYQFPLFRLARIMRHFRPHVVHTRNWGALEGVIAAHLTCVPVVVHSEHGYEMDSLATLPLRRRLFRRAAYAMADAVFTNSHDLRNYHARQAWISPERIGLMYNGVDTTRFAPRPETRPGVRKLLGLPEDCFVVGTVGRLVPIKDHAALLKSAAILAERGVNVRVLLVGAGSERASLQRLISDAPSLVDRVHFSGASDQVPELLNAMDVFALTSLGEGMSNTLLEAMASGLPVVATRVGGNPEVVREGESALLFTAGDSTALADHLERFSRDKDLRLRFGTAARQRVLNQFQLDQMIANYRRLYVELAQRHREFNDGKHHLPA